MDQRLNRRPVRKYGSSGHRPAIGAVTPFVVLSKSRNINEQITASMANISFCDQMAWRQNLAVVERASRNDLALIGENIFDVARSSSNASPIAVPAELRSCKTLVGGRLHRKDRELLSGSAGLESIRLLFQ